MLMAPLCLACMWLLLRAVFPAFQRLHLYAGLAEPGVPLKADLTHHVLISSWLLLPLVFPTLSCQAWKLLLEIIAL